MVNLHERARQKRAALGAWEATAQRQRGIAAPRAAALPPRRRCDPNREAWRSPWSHCGIAGADGAAAARGNFEGKAAHLAAGHVQVVGEVILDLHVRLLRVHCGRGVAAQRRGAGGPQAAARHKPQKPQAVTTQVPHASAARRLPAQRPRTSCFALQLVDVSRARVNLLGHQLNRACRHLRRRNGVRHQPLPWAQGPAAAVWHAPGRREHAVEVDRRACFVRRSWPPNRRRTICRTIQLAFTNLHAPTLHADAAAVQRRGAAARWTCVP